MVSIKTADLCETILNLLPEPIYVMDREGGYLFASAAVQNVLGIKPQDMVGKNWRDLGFPPEIMEPFESALRSVFESGRQVKGETVFPMSSGLRNIEYVVIPIERAGAVEAALVVTRDITRQKLVEVDIEQSRDFFFKMLDDFPNLVWRADAQGKFTFVNKAWSAFSGRTSGEELGDGWADEVHPDDLTRVFKYYLEAFGARRPFEIEFRLRRYDGVYRWMSDHGRPFTDLDGTFAGYIGVTFDITERKERQEELGFLATHDALTGLANRRYLEEQLKRAIAQADRGISSVLLFMDLDGFKNVNDTAGHEVGDLTLIMAGRFIERELRAGDLLARVGGDEFAVLLANVDTEKAASMASRMVQQLKQHLFTVRGRTVRLGLSVGLVAVQPHSETSALLTHADHAMYRAKALGGNRVEPDVS